MQITTTSATYFGALVNYPVDEETVLHLSKLELSLVKALTHQKLDPKEIQRLVLAERNRFMSDLQQHHGDEYLVLKTCYEQAMATKHICNTDGFMMFTHSEQPDDEQHSQPRKKRSGSSFFIRALIATLVIGGAIGFCHSSKAETQMHPHYDDMQSFTTSRWRFSEFAELDSNINKCQQFIQHVMQDYLAKGLKAEKLHHSSQIKQYRFCEKDKSILATCSKDKMRMIKTEDCDD